MKQRCSWPSNNPLMIKYHDEEWGTPQHNDQILFEYLVLDTFQAGLSWAIILKKREGFRKAFDNFNPNKISKYNQNKIDQLIQNTDIVRNKLKINSTIKHAQLFLQLQKEFKTFDNYIWQFTNHKTIHNKFKKLNEIPTTSKESDAMSLDLKKRGFKFTGSTICYAFMQGCGMVNDHTTECFRYNEIKKLNK